MAEAPLVSDDERMALIGRELPTISCEVSKTDIRKLAAAIGDLNPLYLDEGRARKSRYAGIIAHPLQYYVTTYGPVLESELGPDGRADFRRLPLKFTDVVGGGEEIEYFAPARPGDVITAKTKIVDISNKKSSKRGWIAPVVFESTYTNQKGEVLASVRSTIIYW